MGSSVSTTSSGDLSRSGREGLPIGQNAHFTLAVLVVPNLAHDKQVFALYDSFPKCGVEHLPDLRFVSVNGGTVKQTVTAADCACHSIGNFLR
jgi:hypothetical protein